MYGYRKFRYNPNIGIDLTPGVRTTHLAFYKALVWGEKSESCIVSKAQFMKFATF